MDMRMKIIIVVFVVVVVFYFFQFVFNMMKKKEHFSSSYYDDVEGYEDAPVSKPKESETKKKEEEYDMRITLLNEIDKLEIKDNKIKGSIMETVFSDVIMKKLKEMSKEQRTAEIKSIYNGAIANKGEDPSTSTPTSAQTKQETVVEVKKPISQTIKSMYEDAPAMPEIKDYYQNDFKNKTSKALDKLDTAIESLKDMKDILKGEGEGYKDPFIPDLPVPPPPRENYNEKEEVIEGFENIRAFARY